MSKDIEIIEKIGKDNYNKIKDIFKKIDENSEFEFIFYSKRDRNITLTLEKYITLLKFLTKRSIVDKTKILETNNLMLDVSYNPDKETSYRCTLSGKENIDKYMKILSGANNHVVFRNLVQQSKKDKTITVIKKEKNSEESCDIDDLYMRMRLSAEKNLSSEEFSKLSKLENEEMEHITFRLKERTSLYLLKTKDTYVKVDLTITKTENRYTKLNSSIPRYELEIETMSKSKSKDGDENLNIMLKETEILFKVLQQSNFIVTKSESEKVIENYKELLSVPKFHNNLFGRKPITLEIQYTEIIPDKYAVTDKADGERHFLVIFNNKVYLINNNLDVKYTGIVLSKDNQKFNNSVVDGELIFIKNRHVFLVFDCLFNSGIDVRKLLSLEERLKNADQIINKCFIFGNQKGFDFSEKSNIKEFNLNKLLEFHKKQIKTLFDNLNNDIEIEKKLPLIRRKYFIHALGAKPWEIFAYSSLMWSLYTNDNNIKCPYILDGLIYQPNEQAYVADKKNSKYSDYKWKPQEKNSIDFYIEFVKDNNGNISEIYDNSYENISQDVNDIEMGERRIKNQKYKICRLFVGQQVGKTQSPVLFKEKDGLHEAYLLLKDGQVRDDEGNMLVDKTVVEFYYDMTDGIPNKFRWVPLRTRYDKTESVIKHKQQYGNFETVADGNWKSIINPLLMTDFEELAKGNVPEKNIYFYDKKLESIRKRITHEMVISSVKENSYFQKISNLAKPMRAFHNFMKDNLINTFCHEMYDNKKKTILDIGVGRGQDIMKYYYAKAKFVVGIDVDKQALVMPLDGAIDRYNNLKKKSGFPPMYFIQASFNAELDYESQYKALGGMDSNNKQLIEKFFSKEPKARTIFDIIHAGFSLHYGFKDNETFTNLKNNINNYLKQDGYLIITTFDGVKIRELLKTKNKYTQEYTDDNGNVQTLFEIEKKYQDVDESVIMGTGNTIGVYMSWLMNEGSQYDEYLVDERFIVEEFKKDCHLDLVTTDLFNNSYDNYKEFFLHYCNFEAEDRTRKNFLKSTEFYKSNSVNNGCKVYTNLERFYVFRKRKNQALQKGGYLQDPSKFYIPIMTSYTNSNNSFMNSIHHILRSHKIIPQSITPQQFYRDLELDLKKDDELTKDSIIKKIAKNIVVRHQVGGGDDLETVIDGLNVVLVQRDCNNDYNMNLIRKSSRIDDSQVVVILKENEWYAPIYSIDPITQERNGIFEMDDEVIGMLLD